MATKDKSNLKKKISRQYHDVVDSNLNTTDATAQTVTSAVTLNGGLTLGNATTAAATDAAFYTINGKRVEVRSQLQAALNNDTGVAVELRNTSIAADSLIIANFIAPSTSLLSAGAFVTGACVCVNAVAANTASIQIWNNGATMLDNSVFTASIAIL
tara:strand:+ start:284 stop:754 length:471 start_codon:yes stop_codon:yes gene_type:complete